MEYVFNSVWSLLEFYFFLLFWRSFLRTRKPIKIQVISMVIAWVIGIVYMSIVQNQFIKQLLTYFLLFCLSFFLYHGVWYKHIIFVIVGCIINGLMDTIVIYSICALLGISYLEFVWMKLFYVVCVSISKLISILIAWTIFQYRKNVNDRLIQHQWLRLTLLFPVVSMVMLGVIFVGFQDEQDLSVSAVLFSVVLTVANIAIMYLIGIMEKNTKELQENALLHQEMKIQTDSIIALERSYRNQRQVTHEFKNQLQTIWDLLGNDNLIEAKDYIKQLQCDQTTRIFTVNSRHPIIDAVLNHKYQAAKENEIDFQIQVNDLSQISIGTDELVVLLSNLLDNAIEACCRTQDYRSIECTILYDSLVFLSVRNTSNPVMIVNNTIPTSKTPKEEHGFGISRIQRILTQLNAEYTFTYENGWFEFVAEIPMYVK